MQQLNIIFIFLIGISVGSFINVLVDRLPKGEPVLFDRSYCDHCKKKLSWFDLIPLFSFIVLRARCRQCKKKISFQYPLVEFITGVMFLISFASTVWANKSFTTFSFNLADIAVVFYYLFVTFALLVIFFTDLKYRIIPDQMTILLIIVTFLFSPLIISSFLNHLISAISMFLFFLLLFVITRGKGMGFGDVKYSFFMGLVLGFPRILVSFYISFLTGAGISLILVLVGKKRFKSTIAFGPFLVVGTYISILWGDMIWKLIRGILIV